MAQALGDPVGACGDIRLLPPASLDFCKAVHHVECVQQGGRDGYGSVDAFAAFFEAFQAASSCQMKSSRTSSPRSMASPSMWKS
jgi:hypothetical protein